MPVQMTAGELFGTNQRTAAQLFGEDAIDSNKITEEIPNGDKLTTQRPSYRKIYEKILTGEEDWDLFIPAEKRARMRTAMPEYESGGKRLVNSAYLADQLGIDIESAYLTHDQLAETLLKAKTPEDAFERISNRFNNGRTSVKIMDLGYELLTDKGDFETNLKAIEKLQTQLTSDYKKDLRGLGEQIVGATAEQLPNMWEAIKASPWGAVPGGIIGALVAVGVGQLIPAPEEAVTVVPATWMGVKWGGGIAAANRIRQLEAGGMYLELLDMKDENGNKIDPRIAKATAHIVGAINGGIELAQWAVLLETFGIGTKVFENAASKVTAKLFAEGTLKHIAAKYSLKYGTALSAEVFQEILQETTNITLGELAKTLNNMTKGTDMKHITLEELKARYYEVATESLKGFALLVAPGTIVSGAREVVTRKPKVAEITKPVKKPPEAEIIEPIKKPEEKIIEPPITPIKAVEQVFEEPTAKEEEVEFTAQETADLAQLEALPAEEFKPTRRKPAKPIREFLTPKSTVEKVVTEYRALKAGLKKAAQAARKAFVEGKKTGIAKAKQHYLELKQAQKERIALKKRITKAVKVIKKTPPTSVDFFYREAISLIQQGLDPRFRTEKTAQRRKQMKAFLERATEEQKRDFPAKLAAQLEKKTLGDFTVEELEEVAAAIQNLEKLGKVKQKARIAVETAEREKTINKMVDAASGTGVVEEGPKGIDFSREGLLKSMKAAYLWTLRIPRILDWLDGKKGTFSGIWHRTFYDTVNEQTGAELTQTDSRLSSGTAKMKELGITANDLTTVMDFSELQNGLTLTVEQVMGLYAALKNKLATDAVVNGNKINLKAAQAIVSNLNQKYKDLADFIITEYDAHYERLRNAVIEHLNQDMGKEEFYTAMVRLERDGRVTNEELFNQLIQRHGLKKGYAKHGFEIARKNIKAEHQKPIDIRLVSVWQSQVAKQEHYIHFAKPLKQMRKILADPRIKKTLEQKLGKAGWGLIDKYLSRVANPYLYKGFDGLSGLSQKLRRNVAVAYLAYNLLTILKQVPSFVLYAKDAGSASMISSITEFIANPRQMWDMVRAKDPQVLHAFIERELEELRRAKATMKDKDVLGKINKITAQVGDTGMVGIRFVDGVVRTIGWNAVYQKNMQLGLGEAESVRAAQNATLRTQPAAGAKDIAQLYATNEVLNWFTMFTNQLNNLWNISTYDTFAYWNNKKYQDMAMSMMAVSFNALFIWMLVNKTLPDDEEDLLDAASDQILNMLPLVNSAAMAGKRGWGTIAPPPIEAAKTIGAILSAKDKEKAAIRALEATLVLTGVPVTAIKRTGKFIDTGDPMELIGKKRGKRISF